MDNTNVDLDMVSGELIYYSHSLSKDLKSLKLAPTSDAHRGHHRDPRVLVLFRRIIKKNKRRKRIR